MLTVNRRRRGDSTNPAVIWNPATLSDTAYDLDSRLALANGFRMLPRASCIALAMRAIVLWG